LGPADLTGRHAGNGARMRCIIALLLVGLVGPLGAAEAEVPAPPTVPAAPAAADLVQRLEAAPGVVVRADGRAWWQVGEQPTDPAYPIVGVDPDGTPRIETALGALAVDRALVLGGRMDALRALPGLVAHAVAAGVASDEVRLREGVITGMQLYGDTVRVIAEGVLRKDASETPDAQAAAGIAAAVAGLAGAIDGTRIDVLGRRTVQDVLERLSRTDADIDADIEEVVPSFARRVVRHGWLRQVVADAAAPVESAVRAAERLLATVRFTGVDASGRPLLVAEVRDAFGAGGWILRTPTRSAYATAHPRPLYTRSTADLRLVVELPPGADPMAVPVEPVRVRLVQAQGQTTIARWTPEGGLVAEPAVWRRAVPDNGGDGMIADALPPHICLAGLDGDVAGLIVPGGMLRPPVPGAPASEFLDAAGELLLRDPALPDAAYLSLLGEYQFMYVYDSPDPRFPGLMGNRKDKGDIHQTAEQTLASITGGMLRGDCDDLAELYQAIAQRQGLLTYVISLPRHAAAAWASREAADGRWHVYILQTGPALGFAAAELPDALAAAYKHFDANDAFDANGLGLLLRFSGENTRSAWRLSWKIFTDQDYAQLMIDVQRDWHYQTYQRGITTMRGLVAREEAARGAGKADTANYRELSGLYVFTGQFREAVDAHRQAIDAMPAGDGTGRFYMRQELIDHLLAAEDGAGAVAETTRLLDEELPRLRQELGGSTLQVGMALVAALAGHDQPALARRAFDLLLDQTTLPSPFSRQPQNLATQIDALADWVRSDEYRAEVWQRSERLDQLRQAMRAYVGAAIAVVRTARDAPGAPAQQAARSAQRWLDDLAFRDVDDPDDVLVRYAVAANFYAAVLGDEAFHRLLDGVAPPTPPAAGATPTDHTARVGGLAQLPADLPWIAASTPYWFSRLSQQFAGDAAMPADRTAWNTETVRLARQVVAAAAATRALGYDGPAVGHLEHLAQVIAALVGRDAEALAARLDAVVDRDDKRLRDDTAQWLGDAARTLDLDWYGRVIDLWRERVHYKPKWFWIAWRAALAGPEGRPHALLVAERAAQAYADDPTFAEEYAFMTRLFAAPSGH
jgi:hypothetical protein